MLVLKFIFSILLILCFFSSCEDLKRDNLLDPKNEDGYRESVLLVEAFVNISNPFDYSKWTIEGLDRLKQIYGDKVIVAQYHRNVDTTYVEDLIFTTTELSERSLNLQELYVSNSGGDSIFTPDVFINGAYSRVSGASSPTSVEQRIIPFIESMINVKNKFTLEPEIQQVSSQTYEVKCRVARLGNKSMSGYKLKMIAIYDNNHSFGQHVVVDFSTGTEIGSIEAGSYKTISLGQHQFNQTPDVFIFSLTSSNELETFQSVKWEDK